MKRTCVILTFFLLFAGGGFFLQGDESPRFILKKLTPRIQLLRDTQNGGAQLGIISENGIILLDSFSSMPTAQNYRHAWEKALQRKDFAYVLNTVDRLDIFGGNAVFKGIPIVGHKVFYQKFTPAAVEAEISRLIEMWRWKEDVSRKRQATHKPGSEEAKGELAWTAFCKRRAEELEGGFKLRLPDITYSDRMALHLKDLTVELLALGHAGFDGISIVVVPEEKTAVIHGFILHSQHLAPHPQERYAKLDVPRWIRLLEELTAEKGRVDKYIVDTRYLWSRERVQSHLRYIKILWNRVQELEAAGENLEAIQERLSLEKEFAFVKEMHPYKDHGDDWIRPQHRAHIWNFYVQHKKLAARLIQKLLTDHDAEAAIRLVREKAKQHKKIYFDERTLYSLGYWLMTTNKIAAALAVFRLNTEMYPDSANTWDSLGEAWMKKGDSAQAVQCYKKVLQLDPKNENARKMLKKLAKK